MCSTPTCDWGSFSSLAQGEGNDLANSWVDRLCGVWLFAFSCHRVVCGVCVCVCVCGEWLFVFLFCGVVCGHVCDEWLFEFSRCGVVCGACVW